MIVFQSLAAVEFVRRRRQRLYERLMWESPVCWFCGFCLWQRGNLESITHGGSSLWFLSCDRCHDRRADAPGPLIAAQPYQYAGLVNPTFVRSLNTNGPRPLRARRPYLIKRRARRERRRRLLGIKWRMTTEAKAAGQFVCVYCGCDFHDPSYELTLDHLRPTSRGGTDDEANLLLACRRCNLRKGDGPLWGLATYVNKGSGLIVRQDLDNINRRWQRRLNGNRQSVACGISRAE